MHELRGDPLNECTVRTNLIMPGAAGHHIKSGIALNNGNSPLLKSDTKNFLIV